MNLYAYCLGDQITARMVESLAGVAGAGARLIQYGGIAVVVSEIEDERVAVSRENVLAHHRVVAHVLAETTPLPFRFGTVVSAARLQNYMETDRVSLLASLARVRGCVEMSVKIIWDVEKLRNEAAEQSTKVGAQSRDGNIRMGSGAAFLAAKRRTMIGSEWLKKRAEEMAAWIAKHVGDAARESHVNVRPLDALVVQAAHLVERERLEIYRTRIRQAREERPDIHFLTSGAWPPYSFSDVRS